MEDGAAGRMIEDEPGEKVTGEGLQLDGAFEKVKEGGALEMKVKDGAEVPGKVIRVVEGDSGMVDEIVFVGWSNCLKSVLVDEIEEEPGEIPQSTVDEEESGI